MVIKRIINLENFLHFYSNKAMLYFSIGDFFAQVILRDLISIMQRIYIFL